MSRDHDDGDPPVSREPRIQALFGGLKRAGHRPFHPPAGVRLDDVDGNALPHSACIRCDAFDGAPRPTNGKADALDVCVDPALGAHPTLTTIADALRVGDHIAGRP